MASELDDNEGNRKKLRGAPAAAKNAELPHAQDEVTPEVARVVNLLQRLDKLHSKQPQNAPPPPLPPADHTRAQSSKPKHGQSDSGGLSSLGDRYLDRAAPDRNGLRAVPSSPVAFSPPPLPPVRTASSDLPTVLKGLLPVGDELPVHPAVLAPQAPALIEAVEPERARKHKRDDPPVVLIGAAIIGLVVVAGVGMYQFQQIPGAPRDQAVSNPTAGPVRADAAPSVAPNKGPNLVGGACAASLTGTERGVVTLATTDVSRAGQRTAISVDDLNYVATYDAKGNLRFDAPLLTRQAAVRWDQPNGPPCEKQVAWPVGGGMLRVALIWSGEGALDLHIIEPNAWFGGPKGHVSSLNRNEDQSRGAGQIQVFGDAKGSTKAHVYTIEASRLAPGGVLNAFVKPAANVGNTSAACSETGASAEEQQIQYEVQILRNTAQSEEVQRETKTFSLGIPVCGANGGGERSERIIVKN